MKFKQQQKLKQLPQELYFDIFKTINTFPIKFKNNYDEINLKQKLIIKFKSWGRYIINFLISSKIIYISTKKAFYAKKIFLTDTIKYSVQMDSLLAREKVVLDMHTLSTMCDKILQNGWAMPPSCCELNCIYSPTFAGQCMQGKAFVIVNAEALSINYFPPVYGGNQTGIVIDALHYFPILRLKCVKYIFSFETTFGNLLKDNKQQLPIEVSIGFKNNFEKIALWIDKENKFTSSYIICKRGKVNTKLNTFADDDILECGIQSFQNGHFVYFKKNGSKIGKNVLLHEDHVEFVPFVSLRSCSIVKTNFSATTMLSKFDSDPPAYAFYGQDVWET